ncbi:MAG TPA: hypothetical protein VF593_09960, partial [Chthoniobacteraceae bacterium]
QGQSRIRETSEGKADAQNDWHKLFEAPDQRSARFQENDARQKGRCADRPGAMAPRQTSRT